MIRGRAGVALALALAPLLLVACGSEPSSDGPGAAPAGGQAPEADFAAAADDLCTEAQTEQEEIRRQVGGEQITLDDRARLLVDLAPSRVALAAALAGLDPPRGQEDLAARLTATAERRGEASRRAGELWEEDAGERRIAAQAAAEHEERERFVAIATRLGLRACAEILPATERARVVAAVEGGLASPTAQTRCTALSQRYLSELYGGLPGCIAAQRDQAPATSVAVGDVQGYAEILALAGADSVGGSDPGETRVRLVYEDGAYRIDKID